MDLHQQAFQPTLEKIRTLGEALLTCVHGPDRYPDASCPYWVAVNNRRDPNRFFVLPYWHVPKK